MAEVIVALSMSLDRFIPGSDDSVESRWAKAVRGCSSGISVATLPFANTRPRRAGRVRATIQALQQQRPGVRRSRRERRCGRNGQAHLRHHGWLWRQWPAARPPTVCGDAPHPATGAARENRYTFVTDGVESAIEHAKAAAAFERGCSTRLRSTWCRCCLAQVCACSTTSVRRASTWRSSESSTRRVSRISGTASSGSAAASSAYT
jgi:hypothetical protein